MQTPAPGFPPSAFAWGATPLSKIPGSAPDLYGDHRCRALGGGVDRMNLILRVHAQGRIQDWFEGGGGGVQKLQM